MNNSDIVTCALHRINCEAEKAKEKTREILDEPIPRDTVEQSQRFWYWQGVFESSRYAACILEEELDKEQT